ncbi:MAG: hypothetical protein GTO02_01565, partial [Candidatus Dadabacteria bacterium]|nr:hypothetical protein [Candidatus Dadabacteria bacterium]
MKIISGNDTNKAISDYIVNNRYPYLIGRCSWSENNVCLEYLKNNKDVCKISPRSIYYIKQNAGFYAGDNIVDNCNIESWLPKHQQALKFFIEKFIESQSNCDLLFKHKDSLYVPDNRKEIHIWSPIQLTVWLPLLEGKRILAVSPFEDSIKEQFPKRHQLFKTPKVIRGQKNPPINYPEFELVILKSPHTIMGNETPHDDWKETFID